MDKQIDIPEFLNNKATNVVTLPEDKISEICHRIHKKGFILGKKIGYFEGLFTGVCIVGTLIILGILVITVYEAHQVRQIHLPPALETIDVPQKQDLNIL